MTAMRLTTTAPLRALRFLSARVLAPMVWGAGLCALIAILVPFSLDHVRAAVQIAQLQHAIRTVNSAPAAPAAAPRPDTLAPRTVPPGKDYWNQPPQPGETAIPGSHYMVDAFTAKVMAAQPRTR